MSRVAPTMPPRTEPSLFYWLTARLNVLVWKLPLPQRVLVRLSTTIYHSPPMPGTAVLAIVGALRAAGVRCWISGGWGLDALAAEHTRTHHDLDLIVEERDMPRAEEVFADLGFREWWRAVSDLPLQTQVVLQAGDAGLAVDLHPLDLSSTHIEFATGTIDGQPVPCISASLQTRLHTHYRPPRSDVAVLRSLPETPLTTLIVPVSEAEALVDSSAREAGMPAHVTLVLPVLDADAIDGETESVLASLLAQTPAFDFELSEIGLFPGVVYVRPEPAAPFLALARALAQHWPKREPGAGAAEEAIPHLPVGYGKTIPRGIAERLPVSARAEEAWLMSKDAAQWMCRRAFRLGG
jgi:2'-5' RNA ligase